MCAGVLGAHIVPHVKQRHVQRVLVMRISLPRSQHVSDRTAEETAARRPEDRVCFACRCTSVDSVGSHITAVADGRQSHCSATLSRSNRRMVHIRCSAADLQWKPSTALRCAPSHRITSCAACRQRDESELYTIVCSTAYGTYPRQHGRTPAQNATSLAADSPRPPRPARPKPPPAANHSQQGHHRTVCTVPLWTGRDE